MTIHQIYTQYMPTKEITLSVNTVSAYKSLYANHIEPKLGLREIGTLHFIDYQKFADNLTTVLGLSPKTVTNILKFISSLYTFAIKNEWYSGEIFARTVDVPHFDNKYYVTMSPDMQKKYLMALKYAKEPVYKDIFLFLLHGRRLGEVIKLEWEYLDLHQGIVYYPSTKNKSKRHLAYELTKDLLEVLSVHYEEAVVRQNTVFPTGYVFINPNTGRRYKDIRPGWKRLLLLNNLPHTKVHNIRHILGTYLVNELSIPLESVSFVLGHQDTAITKRYVNIKPKVAKNAIDILFKDIKSKGEKAVENLNDVYKLGESFQEILFHAKELNEVAT